MAVEAHQLNPFPSQLICNREIMNPIEANLYNTHIDYSSLLPFSATTALTEASLPPPPYNSFAADSFLRKPAVKSESGLTYNNNDNNFVPMLRKRYIDNSNSINHFSLPFYSDSYSFLGQDISVQMQQQQLAIDQLIMQRMEKVRVEIREKRKRHARKMIEEVEDMVMKKLKAKEEEIEKIGKLNWALEERVKALCIENQIWRDLAQSNEATANALRTNLEQVLAQRGGVIDDEGVTVCPAVVMDDAQSCCGSTGDNEKEVWRKLAGCAGVKDKDEYEDDGCTRTKMANNGISRLCRNCMKVESCVLILPCRHLCVCTGCGSTLHTCPICKSFKTASVHVNMS
ncbi:probable BOI-related E3 ubiquitin-protein ligase 3 [Abrus precatorius]|uniref:Probable BOI-related E3 ubiquitin-protein ligase 3 n=1 Tax=Abrus precatorius TaxID=3816 RepID=A0A8B8KEZ9_ABRPR|nr:probable BOI-related E3 ubiquitin-protein ligase 3 [Abrus precatorius]